MSDPRVEALAGSLAHDIDHDASLGPYWRRDARRGLEMVDAADPLLPKVRALLDAAREITCALDHTEAWNLDFSDAIALRNTERAFTADDLARLGITGGSE